MYTIKKILMNILLGLCIMTFAFITLIGTYQVAARYIFNKPSAWTEELLTYGFVYMAILAATYVFGTREHMKLTFIVDKFSLKTGKVFEIISELAIILFSSAVFIYGGIKISTLTYIQITPALQWSTGTLYFIIPIAGVFIVLFSISNIVETVNNKTLTHGMEE